jgi:uncharacterized protein (DUF427 family)
MYMKATWNDQVIAEAPQEDLIRIEGNWYFPPTAMNHDYFAESDHRTVCYWKGEASYYNVTVGGNVNEFGAWYYAVPMQGSVERVGKDFTNYVAFWNGITVTN